VTPTTPRIPTTTTVAVNGREIEALHLAGDPDRRPIVLLHEGLGSLGLWRAFPQQLQQATGRRIVAFSRHGHGRSQPPPTPRTPAFFHQEALDVLPQLLVGLDAAEPILLGHSDGGSIALIHAGHHPVTGLVTLAAHVFVEDVSVRAIERTRRSYYEDGLRERMARHHDDPDVAFHGWCDVWLDPEFARTWDLVPDARAITAPTLVIQGADDAYGSLEQVQRIAGAVGGPVTRLIVPGGHSCHLEQPDAVTAAITAFAAALP
jgi:pimeloyl-ACP methyl ester carboxylesterase